jgi:dUTP diphosphatase
LSPEATLPTKPYSTDACYDLYALSTVRISGFGVAQIKTGVAFNIPAGYFGQIYERSGVSLQTPLSKKAGVIDAGYTGEIIVIIRNDSEYPFDIMAKTKIAQIHFHLNPQIELKQVTEFSNVTERGDKGFGSSGN